MPFGTGAVIAAGIGAAASVGSGLMQQNAVSGASNASQQDQRIAYLVGQEQLRPYREAGNFAMERIGELTGQYGAEGRDAFYNAFRADPGYQYTVDQALRGVDAGAASKGILNSGATIKAEQDRAYNLADQQFNSYVNRLYGLAQFGQNSATNSATQGITTGTNMANTALQEGGAQATIYGNMGAGISNTVNSLFSNKQFTSGLKNWLGGSGSTSGSDSIYGTGANTDMLWTY
jgi:hypothetical protein